MDGLYITSDRNETKKDNAIEIDIDNETWANVSALEEDAHVVIQNCVIDSKGFTGIHISGYNGITLKGNDIEASFTDRTNETNILNWGASAKFLACKNIKFIQNNFRGSQPTLLWIQDSENALFMNNVFWNTNTYTTTGGVTPSAIRLVNQYGKTIQNISFFYNTFYFEENGTTGNTSKYNFFIKYSAASNGSTTGSQYFGSNIYFQYNNCYSYDKDCPGSDAFYATGSGDGTSVTYGVNSGKTDDANFCPNNFWSVYDYDNNKQKSVFDFTTCNGSQIINVQNQVCETTASGPASLIVKGDGMNLGNPLTEDEINLTGLSLTDKESFSDRYLIDARKSDEKWTYGAYQSRDDIPTETIYWVGISEDWDDRNNWEYETKKDPNDTSENPEMIRQRVSCVNTFSENLKVIVEEAGGRVTDLFGNDQRYDKDIKGAVISNGIVHEEALKTIKEEDILRWKRHCGLEFLNCACSVTDGTIVHESKRKEIKELIENLKKINKNVDINILRSSENVNLDSILGYVHDFCVEKEITLFISSLLQFCVMMRKIERQNLSK